MDPTQDNQGGAGTGDNRQALFSAQPEQDVQSSEQATQPEVQQEVSPSPDITMQPEVTPNPDTAPAQPSTDLAHPYFSNPSTQTLSTETGDIILNSGAPKAKQNKRPFIIGGIILAVFVSICLIILAVVAGSSSKKESEIATSIGKINTTIIFDASAPIPMESNGNYGYINPENGAQSISARFLSADKFYGNYAVVQIGSEGDIRETAIINRSGETVFTFAGENAGTYYDIENNYWMVDGDLYDTKMQKISPNGTIGKYIGNGYVLVISESTNDNQASATGSTDAPAAINNADSKVYDGPGYIMTLSGDKAYSCDQYCSAITLVADDIPYGIVHIWGGNSQIVNLLDGAVIYTTSQNRISLQGNTLVERSDDSVKYSVIKNNQLVSVARPEDTLISISDSGEYIIEECNNTKYSIKTIHGGVVSQCDIEEYYELPHTLYLAYQNNFAKAPIFIVRSGELQLFDMSKAQAIKNFAGEMVDMFEYSPFIHIQGTAEDKTQVCNLLSRSNNSDDSCIDLESLVIVDGYSNYFTVNDGKKTVVYNSKLKEIKL